MGVKREHWEEKSELWLILNSQPPSMKSCCPGTIFIISKMTHIYLSAEIASVIKVSAKFSLEHALISTFKSFFIVITTPNL